MTWVEGKEGREETLLPSKHTEQLLYLPQGVCFPPPPPFFYSFVTTHFGEEFLLYNYQPVPARREQSQAT